MMTALLFAACAAPLEAGATTPETQPLATGSVLDAVGRLKAGEYLWAPQIAPSGPILFVINITTQRAVLYRNGVPIGITTVSTARRGYRTPTGVFTVLQKQVRHFSSIYDNAPMPYMQRLTWGGVALHGGQLPGYPASHGCIRLPQAFARLLYGETRRGMTVMIVREDMLPAFAPTIDPLQTGIATDPATGYSWQPEQSPEGPMTAILSAADKRVVVIRNGRLIGSAPAAFDVPITGPSLYTLQSIDAAGRHWVRTSLPGQGDVAPPSAEMQQIHLPEAFRQLVLSALEPGSTVLLTPDSIELRETTRSRKLIESK